MSLIIITMGQARKLCLPLYYTGKLCPNGHLSERRTINGSCLVCEKIKSPLYYQANKEIRKAYDKKYYRENHVECLRRRTNYRLLNPTIVRKCREAKPLQYSAGTKSWRALNRKRLNASDAKRRAAKLQRIPPWADLDKIQDFYRKCPKGLTVDHIIPLQGKLVSGLHVLNNLQYLTFEENSRKRNFFDPNTWEEPLCLKR